MRRIWSESLQREIAGQESHVLDRQEAVSLDSPLEQITRDRRVSDRGHAEQLPGGRVRPVPPVTDLRALRDGVDIDRPGYRLELPAQLGISWKPAPRLRNQ